MLLNDKIKKDIFFKLNEIINLQDENWNKLDSQIKIKIIHHFCSFLGSVNVSSTNDFNNNNSIITIINSNLSNNITIPLKSNKPKKLIEFMGINKNYNSNLFSEFNKSMLDYTFTFRNIYNVNDSNRKYYTFNNLPKQNYYEILSSINNIVYIFISKYKKYISASRFYNNVIGSNQKKLITENNHPKDFNIQIENNFLFIKFSNDIQLKLELFYTSDKITKNIPVKYNIKLINQI